MSEPTQTVVPAPTPIANAPGAGEEADDITELTPGEQPPVAEGDVVAAPEPNRPDPCTAMGGE